MIPVNIEQVDRFFHDLNFRFDTVAELDLHLANRFNVFRWLYPEIALSSIIRELLDPKGVHGQGDAFLRRFLDMVGLGRLAVDPNAPRPTCEEPTTYATSPLRRIDIFLRPDNRFAIGIENKPRAADQPGWVKDYSDHLTNKYGDGYLLIYLTAAPGVPRATTNERQRDLGASF